MLNKINILLVLILCSLWVLFIKVSELLVLLMKECVVFIDKVIEFRVKMFLFLFMK